MRPTKILVVEDEPVMRRVLGLVLASHGYQVQEAPTGEHALRAIRTNPPAAVLLDLGLPDIDGLDLIRLIRRASNLPILVVSGRVDEQHLIQALDSGANDYIHKPFREGELMARLRASLRTVFSSPAPEISAGDVRLHLVDRRAFVATREIDLTPTEFDLLALLVSDAGRVVSHARLLQEVWGPEHAEEVQYLRVYMKQLRRKIEEDPPRPKRILTALGVGYRLVPQPNVIVN